MATLDELKRKRLEQLQAQQQSQAQQEAQLAEQIQALEEMVRQLMTREALQRYGSLKAAHPEKAIQVLAVLGQIMQSQKIRQITDEQLKQLLIQITPQKKEFTITRR